MAKGLGGIVLSERLFLKKWDPDEDTYVVFQRPARWESEQIAAMQAKAELVIPDEGRDLIQRERTAVPVIEAQMVCMCLVECNLPDENGEPVFVPGRTCRAKRKRMTERVQEGFYRAWYRPDFPDDLAEEMIELLRQWHPPFNWRGGGEEEEEGEGEGGKVSQGED